MEDQSEFKDRREIFAPLRQAVDELGSLPFKDKPWISTEKSMFADALESASIGSSDIESRTTSEYCLDVIIVTKTSSLEAMKFEVERLRGHGSFHPPLGAYMKNGLDRLSSDLGRLQGRVVLVSIERLPAIDFTHMSLLHRAYGINLPMLWYCFRHVPAWRLRSSEQRRFVAPTSTLLEQVSNEWTSPRLLCLGSDNTIFLPADESLKPRVIPTGRSIA